MNILGDRGVIGLVRAEMRAMVVVAALTALALGSACGGRGDASPASLGSAAGTTATGQAARAGQGGRVAKAGDRVSVHYTGTLDDGKQFDSSKGREPLSFTVGAGDVIAGFDRAVTGLDVGKSVKVRMEPKDAYGERRDDLLVSVPAAQAPPGLQLGQSVSLGGRRAVVTKITVETVTVDTNHELAGKALNFEIELVSIDS